MNWENLRGTAIDNKKHSDKDFNKIKIKIAYVVNKELQQWKKKNLKNENTYGIWVNK